MNVHLHFAKKNRQTNIVGLEEAVRGALCYGFIQEQKP